ncbi:hypothetical protein F5Y16DRAFT_338650 [Xylariaceae sp. FL0255]|nr:hypothetical protein F5Y16DRAFT_338650 [Xylariaceae sp. FL0255]
MSRTLEPTLYSLLPTYSTALPQPLLKLAASLLARSRHSAGALKAEEEVARSYACAHLACDRLKISLDLPPIQVRPPIPPRLYKRLYAHLDNVLPITSTTKKSSRIRTPTSKAKDSPIFGSSQRIPSRATPSKDTSLAQFRSPAGKTPTKSASKPPPLAAKKKAGGAISALPAWIRPTIQLLCKELEQEQIGKYVLAGIQTIVAPLGRRTKDAWVNDNLTTLLAAVFSLVASQVHVLKRGRQLDSRQYKRIRAAVLETLDHAQQKIEVQGMDEDELWIGWSDITSKDVDKGMAEIIKKGWQKEEWFAGLEQASQWVDPADEDNDVEMGEDLDVEDDDEQQVSERLHMQKADTMLQSRWNMTQQKRREYRQWKEDMLRRIKEIETARETGMEVDSIA